jgi:hypothetical protein
LTPWRIRTDSFRPTCTTRGGWTAEVNRDGGAGDGELFDFVREVEQVVRVDDGGHAATAGTQGLLEPGVQRPRECEPGLSVREGADRFRTLIQSLHDDQAGEVLAVLIAGDQADIDIVSASEKCSRS